MKKAAGGESSLPSKSPNNDLDEASELSDLTGEALPEELREQLQEAVSKGDVTIITSRQFEASFAGPLPHPDTLKGYEEALPGSAERIVSRLEGQTSHRQFLERRGQVIAGALCALAIVASVVCALAGQPLVAASIIFSVMLAVGLTGVLSLFFNRQR